MVRLARWHLRAPEEAYLFNPPFIGSLTTEFVKSYGKSHSVAPMTLAVVALAAVLHGQTRRRFPYSTVTSLYEWLQDNEDLLVGFAKRAQGLLPYVKEGTIFAVSHNALCVEQGHHLCQGAAKATFSSAFLETATPEIKEIVDRTRFLARWFAKSGSEASILAAWGVRP